MTPARELWKARSPESALSFRAVSKQNILLKN